MRFIALFYHRPIHCDFEECLSATITTIDVYLVLSLPYLHAFRANNVTAAYLYDSRLS
jgi:hypothetical protein